MVGRVLIVNCCSTLSCPAAARSGAGSGYQGERVFVGWRKWRQKQKIRKIGVYRPNVEHKQIISKENKGFYGF